MQCKYARRPTILNIRVVFFFSSLLLKMERVKNNIQFTGKFEIRASFVAVCKSVRETKSAITDEKKNQAASTMSLMLCDACIFHLNPDSVSSILCFSYCTFFPFTWILIHTSPATVNPLSFCLSFYLPATLYDFCAKYWAKYDFTPLSHPIFIFAHS